MLERSERLNQKISLLNPSMQSAAKRLYSHDRFGELYPHYLCAVHTTVRASVPLLKLGEQRCLNLADDPVAEMLAGYYAEHAEEEAEHDVWLLEDLEVLGISSEEVMQQVPGTAAACMVGPQYYWIENFHPVSLLGYMAILERPVDPEFFRQLSRKWDIPESAFRSILLHATLDGDHRADMDNLINRLPLTDAQESMLGVSAIATAGATAQFFNDVVDRFERAK